MADKGIASLSASILPDSIKTRLSGVLTYDPSVTLTASTGEAWVYKEHLVTSSDTAIFAVTDDYIAGKSAGAVGGTAVDTDDKIRWICIEHTGTINGSVATAEGVMLGLNETSAYNLTNGILIEPNEMLVLKTPNITVAAFKAITCTASGGVPLAVGGGNNIKIRVAAILVNVD